MRWGYDVEEARNQLQEYKEIARSDFESAEEYSEARADAWQEFVDSIDTISKEEEEVKAAPPKPKPKPPKKVVKPPEKPEEKVTIKQLTQAAINLLTAGPKHMPKSWQRSRARTPVRTLSLSSGIQRTAVILTRWLPRPILNSSLVNIKQC